jgi:pimeloyl-ACP methyl ester carboxylesterase
VLIHGWTCDSTFFAPQIAELSKTYRVLAVDLIGHGRSDKPQATYDGPLMARSVLAAMDAARIDKAVLLGHSMGFPVARTVYARAPQRVLGLIAADGSVFSGSMANFAKSLGGPTGPETRRKMVEHMFAPSTTEAIRKQILDTMLAAPEHVAVSAMTHGISSPLWKEPAVRVPALAVQQKRHAGQEQPKYLFEAAFSDLEYREMEGVSQFLNMEKPAEFNSIVLSWIRSKVPAQ